MGKRKGMTQADVDLLAQVRQNPDIWDNFADREGLDAKSLQFNRQRLLKVLIKDLRIEEDYELVKYLFKQELILRKRLSPVYPEGYDKTLIYLGAFLLVKFRQVEDLWRFVELKSLDENSDKEFDLEHLLALGIDKVYNLMAKTDNPLQFKAARLIGKRPENAPFTEEQLRKWEESKATSFGQ
ncbi:MAG: hypothetical protein MRZ79_19520 [Bacteroidia bacterium]|nr:hypothetical protein [Bacteroidia bacterium]